MTNYHQEYKRLLGEFVSFKSISTDEKYKKDIEACVLWLEKLFKNSNFNVKIIKNKKTNPVIIAKYFLSEKVKTALIYGHYDVQPATKDDGWNNDPFKLESSEKKFFARGVVDNKGQILIHIITAIRLIKENKLNYNLIFLIEGNEETSNPDLPLILKKYKKDLKCDFAIVSDGELTNNKPTIEISLRGGFNARLVYKTGENNLHSGIFGGAVPSAPLELSKFLNSLFDENGKVKYKDFYEDIDKITKGEILNNRKLEKESKDLRKLTKTYKINSDLKYDFFTLTGLLPTIQITGIKSGYIDSGFANIVPSVAEVRLNFRIVSSQDPKKIAASFKKFVKIKTPKHVKYELYFNGLHSPIKINAKNEYLKRAEKLLMKVYKTEVNRRNVGGAIPFVADCKKILNIDTLLIPFGNEDCSMHGKNENFDMSLIEKGLEFSYNFFTK